MLALSMVLVVFLGIYGINEIKDAFINYRKEKRRKKKIHISEYECQGQ
jgi:hypothetical protein